MCKILQQTDLESLFSLAEIDVFLFEMRVCVLSKMSLFFLSFVTNLAGWIPSSFLISLLCKTGKILWPTSTEQTTYCLKKLHLQFLISEFTCFYVFWYYERKQTDQEYFHLLEEIRICAAFSPRFFPVLCSLLLSTFEPIVLSQQHLWVGVQ